MNHEEKRKTNGEPALFRAARCVFLTLSLFVDALLLLYALELISRRNGDGILVFSINQPKLFFASALFLFLQLLTAAILFRPRRGVRITNALWLAVAAVSYFKTDYRGEPLLLTDLLQAKEGLAIAGKLHFSFPWFLVAPCALLVVAIPFLFPKKSPIASFPKRMLAAACAALALCACVRWALGIRLVPTYQYKNLFLENGFLPGLAETRPKQELQQPEDYSKERIAGILRDAPDGTGTEPALLPDVFFIMSESLFDLAGKTDLAFSADPLEGLRALAPEHVVSSVITPGYGGGTFYAEYEVLTGYRAKETPTRIYYDSQIIQPGMRSVVRAFSERGYKTAAVHPNTGTFYNRIRSYTALGFDDLYFKKELGTFQEYVGGFPSDRELFQKLLRIYREDLLDGAPHFYHVVTYQNHGSYNYEYARRDVRIANIEDEVTRNSAENYANAVLTHVEALRELLSALEDSERPALVVLWGDHAPAVRFLGAELPSAARERAGFYTTPLLIWNNYGAKYDWPEEYVATYRLGAKILQLLGMDGDGYYRWLVREGMPDMATALGLMEENGRFYEDTAAYRQLDEDLVALHYDRLIGRRYGEEIAK